MYAYTHVYGWQIAWHASSPGEDTVLNWVSPIQSERHWRSTIIMAYHCSAHLAYQMINRYGRGGGGNKIKGWEWEVGTRLILTD